MFICAILFFLIGIFAADYHVALVATAAAGLAKALFILGSAARQRAVGADSGRVQRIRRNLVRAGRTGKEAS